MSKKRTEAFVISAFSFGESHKIITLFTPFDGIIKAVAHGIRKPKSRFASSFEMFNLVDMVVADSSKSELYTVKEASVINYFDNLKKDSTLSGYLFYFAEFINEFFKNAPPSNEVFLMVKKYLECAEGGNSYNFIISLMFKILYSLGFLPQAGVCFECETLSDALFLKMPGGEMVCTGCLKSGSHKKISGADLKIYRLFQNEEIKTIKNFKITLDQQYSLDALLCDVVSSILGKALKSRSFLYLNNWKSEAIF